MRNMAEQPRIRSVNILMWLYREHAERFTIRDVMLKYEMKRGEVQRRVNYMRHLFGAVRLIGEVKAHRRGRREKVYALTRWGNKYAAKAMKTSGRKAAANKPNRRSGK